MLSLAPLLLDLANNRERAALRHAHRHLADVIVRDEILTLKDGALTALHEALEQAGALGYDEYRVTVLYARAWHEVLERARSEGMLDTVRPHLSLVR